MSTSVLERPRVNEQHSVATSDEPTSIIHEAPHIHFTPEQIVSMQRDDAMASAVVAIILSCAFLVLLCLAFAANVWTTCFAT